MKYSKYLLVLLFNVLIFSSCNDDDTPEVAYTSIPDSNFEAALEVLGLDDIPNDGQVPTAKINAITSLAVSGKDIADLTGIQDFEALTDLNVSNNKLTDLNVSILTKLISLNASQNLLGFFGLNVQNGNNTNMWIFR